MVALEFIHSYIDDLLCILRASLDNHLQKLNRNKQSEYVSVPEIIMVFNFKEYFLFNLCGPAMIKNFTLSKAVLFHLRKIYHHLKTLIRGLHVAFGLIEVRIWSSSLAQIGRQSKFLFATPRTLNFCPSTSVVCDSIHYIHFLMTGLTFLFHSSF